MRRRVVVALLRRTIAGRWAAREWGPRRCMLRRVRAFRRKMQDELHARGLA